MWRAAAQFCRCPRWLMRTVPDALSSRPMAFLGSRPAADGLQTCHQRQSITYTYMAYTGRAWLRVGRRLHSTHGGIANLVNLPRPSGCSTHGPWPWFALSAQHRRIVPTAARVRVGYPARRMLLLFHQEPKTQPSGTLPGGRGTHRRSGMGHNTQRKFRRHAFTVARRTHTTQADGVRCW